MGLNYYITLQSWWAEQLSEHSPTSTPRCESQGYELSIRSLTVACGSTPTRYSRCSSGSEIQTWYPSKNSTSRELRSITSPCSSETKTSGSEKHSTRQLQIGCSNFQTEETTSPNSSLTCSPLSTIQTKKFENSHLSSLKKWVLRLKRKKRRSSETTSNSVSTASGSRADKTSTLSASPPLSPLDRE